MVRGVQDSSVAVLRDVIRPGTTRGLDFITLEELRKRTGVNPQDVLKFALAELLCNALDKEDASEISVEVQTEGELYRLAVSDNGSKKLTERELRLILDFENKASSKRGLLMVSRGYLGNALKCIIGYSYALTESKALAPPDIVIESGSYEYRIVLKPDRIREVIRSEIATARREDDGLTTFVVRLPRDGTLQSPSVLKDLIFATGMVNPSRRITYNIFNESRSLGSAGENKPIRRETSALWYTEKQFQSLFKDFVRARPQTQLKEFISLFRGFTSRKVIAQIVEELNNGEKLQKPNFQDRDFRDTVLVQFFPTTSIGDLPEQIVSRLFAIMKGRSKSIAKRSITSVLGCVGEKSFDKVREQNGWERLRYVMMSGTREECPEYYHGDGRCHNLDHVEFPFLIEIAVFDRKREDQEGLKVYQCVNFMASMEDIFSRIYNINYHLGRVGIGRDMPVTVVSHLVCPVLKWLNYGKSGLNE